jgi:tetratricopeptide (TPR) repeat protein
VRPDFRITAANAAAAGELARRLEGIPLALSLAAGRLQLLTPEQLLARLPARLDLAARDRDAPARHRTLRAAIEWSYRELSPPLRRLFARLSVFRGGFTLEAAEAVCDDPLVLDGLADLRERSLLGVRDGAGVTRFVLLETLREYAAEQLAPAEARDVARAHAAHFVERCARARSAFGGPESRAVQDELAAEYENLRAVIDRADADPTLVDASLDVAATVGRLLSAVRGPASEGRALLSRALAREGGAGGPRGRAARTAGVLALIQGDVAAARELTEQAIRLSQAHGDAPTHAAALSDLASAHMLAHEHEAARRRFAEAEEVATRCGLTRVALVVALNLGSLDMLLGDHRAARARFDRLLEQLRAGGDRALTVQALRLQGQLAVVVGDLEGARAALGEGLALARANGLTVEVGWLLLAQGEAAFEAGDVLAARSLLDEGLRVFEGAGVTIGLVRGRMVRARCLAPDDPDVRRDLVAAAAAFQKAGEVLNEAYARRTLADVERTLGDREGARRTYRELLERLSAAERTSPAASFESLAAFLAAEPGGAATAARLAGVADALRAASGARRLPPRGARPGGRVDPRGRRARRRGLRAGAGRGRRAVPRRGPGARAALARDLTWARAERARPPRVRMAPPGFQAAERVAL